MIPFVAFQFSSKRCLPADWFMAKVTARVLTASG